MTMSFRTGYLDKAVTNVDKVVRTARRELAGVEFDTFVGTGFSGSLVVPILARSMKKKFLLVRKDADNSHHSGRLVGDLGERFIFLDDFISLGGTKKRVLGMIEDAVEERNADIRVANKWLLEQNREPESTPEVVTTHVGDYLYAQGERWFPNNPTNPNA